MVAGHCWRGLCLKLLSILKEIQQVLLQILLRRGGGVDLIDVGITVTGKGSLMEVSLVGV